MNFHFIWTIVYKGLPAEYNASSEVEQNAGVTIGTVGQENQSKVKGIKLMEKIPIYVYSTDRENIMKNTKENLISLKRTGELQKQWTEIQSNNKLVLF